MGKPTDLDSILRGKLLTTFQKKCARWLYKRKGPKATRRFVARSARSNFHLVLRG